MQQAGTRFSETSVIAGNYVITFPDYPAEIRASAVTLAGVSSFDLSFSSNEIFITADPLGVLVAMNPAALKANLSDLKISHRTAEAHHQNLMVKLDAGDMTMLMRFVVTHKFVPFD